MGTEPGGHTGPGVIQGVRRRVRAQRAELKERLRLAAARRGIRVTVIVPVYNTEPYLPELLASLDDQGLDPRQLQVILVDDGSTDGSGALLDAYADIHQNVIVIHQPNSGWPGQPRNRALKLAVGHWIFFADSDDYLTTNALRELADFGDQHDAQLVLPRVGRAGTRRSGRPFDETLIDTPTRLTFRTFTPHKLVRRSLVEQHEIRFPEGKVRLEDGIFFSRCYLLAGRISTLADRDYYLLRGRTDGGNLSYQRTQPEQYVDSLHRIADNVHELARSQKVSDALIAELIRRKCFRLYLPERFPRYHRPNQERWLAAHRELLQRNLTPGVRANLSKRNQRRCDMILAGDRDGLLADIAQRAAVVS